VIDAHMNMAAYLWAAYALMVALVVALNVAEYLRRTRGAGPRANDSERLRGYE